MSFQLQDSQKVALAVMEVDAAGNPVALPGPFVWDSSDPSLVMITDNGDGTAVATAVGPLGSVQVNVTDTDEVPQLTGQLMVDVVAGPPAAITIVPGSPENK